MQDAENERDEDRQNGNNVGLFVAPMFRLLFGIGHDRLRRSG